MALLSRTKTPQPDDERVPNLRADPRIVPANELLGAFNARMDLLQRAKLRIGYEQHFGSRLPEDDSDHDKPMRLKLQELQRDPQISSLSLAGPDAPSGPVALGLEILNGKPVPAPMNVADRVRDIDQQIAALQEAVRAQTEICDAIAATLTVEFATALKPRWNEIQLEMYRAAQELARSARRVREFRAAIVAAGIGSASTILSMPSVRAPLILGDESDWSSEIAGWRRTLQVLGIIP